MSTLDKLQRRATFAINVRGRAAKGLIVSAGLLALAAGSANAAETDYQFALVGKPGLSGDNDVITVRLTHQPDGKPITNTLLTNYTIDMEPGGMSAMTAPVANLPNRDGMYVFEVSPVMPGKWALRLVAKVDGGRQTLRQTILVDLLR